MSSFTMPFAGFTLAGSVDAPALRRPASDSDERTWVTAAKRRDPEAFRRLVNRYGDEIVDLCVRIIRSREEAEEAAQDAFVRAWSALPSFREESRFSTWLYRIAVRRALDAARALRSRRDRERVEDPALLEAVAPVPGLGAPEQRRLWRILGDLEPAPRAVVSLFYVGGRGVAEVAAILEMPEGTVKTHLHRSREILRRAWIRETSREERHGLPRV